jgi:hypothetical protein
MIEVKIFLITCDESQHILPVTVYLLNKYFNTKLNIVILGYTKSKYYFPNNVEYIELKQGEKRDKTRWFHDVYNYFNTIKDEYVIFSVDDLPVINYVNLKNLDYMLNFMKKHDSSLAYGHIDGRSGTLLEVNNEYKIYNTLSNYSHKTNLQMNIWKRKDLMSVLKNTDNPVDFELKGNFFINNNNVFQYIGLHKYSEKIINRGLFPTHTWGFLSESRNKGNINILGLNSIDIQYIIDNNLVDVNKLVYSSASDCIVPYNVFGNNFTFNDYKNYIVHKGWNPNDLGYGYSIVAFESWYDSTKRDISNETTIKTNNLLTNKNTMEYLFKIDNYPVSLSSIDCSFNNIKTMDMVFEICKETGIIQVRNAPSLNDIYINSHNTSYGAIWNNLFNEFTESINFYTSNMSNFNILEIGGGFLMLANKILKTNLKVDNYTVYEVNSSFKYANSSKIELIDEYFLANTKLNKSYDMVIHSHVLEHVWNPVDFLNIISRVLTNGKMHCFIVPNLKQTLSKKYANSLNFEHNFFIIEDYIDIILHNNNFEIMEKKYYLDHSIMYFTKKIEGNDLKNICFPNLYEENKLIAMDWFQYNKNIVEKFNRQLLNFEGEVYLFGATNFAILLIKLGLCTDKILCILDNSKEKEGQKVYGCEFIIKNPAIIQNKQSVAVILKAASYQNEIKQQLYELNSNVTIIEE